eukprot:UN24254
MTQAINLQRGGSLIPKWAKFASHIRSRTLDESKNSQSSQYTRVG